MQQQDATHIRRVLAFSLGALIVTASGAAFTFALNLKVLGIVLALLAVFNLVNVAVILVQKRRSTMR